MAPSKKQPQSCRLIKNDESIPYTPATPPWTLDESTHGATPPQPGGQSFCKCIWLAIAPAPFLVDPVTFEFKSIWTPRADDALATLWFHSRLHAESHGTWTSNHYHEALSVLLGHRVSQHDFFTRIKHMRNTLPQCWIDASMASSSSTAVTEVFKEVNAKWEVFFGKFEIWDGIVKNREEEAGKELTPFAQWDRVVELSTDVDRMLARKEDLPEHFDGWLKWWIGR